MEESFETDVEDDGTTGLLLNEQHRTVKELLEQLKMRKSSAKQQQEVERVKPQREKVHQTLILDPAQRKRLQQQMQQDVQLLTQIHLLASSNPSLSLEASTTRIFLFYQKTQQLPILMKCCEEIQPVEREEHQLPFWLKASLPSIQEEMRRIADGAREVGNVTRTTEINSDPGLGKSNLELESETRYPLLLPKAVVLKLKPVFSFCRNVWRQKLLSALKPFLIRPSPSARSAHSEALPSKMVVRIPPLIQPATVLQAVPGGPPLGVPGGDSFESPAALPATAAEARTSFPLPEPQTLLSSAPVPKLMLPSLAPSKFRKPCVKRRASKRKGPKASLCLKPAPLIRPAPVFFTVPATTVKAVSLGGGCSMVQPVSAAVAQSPQTIPITTLLVNPAPFPCSLNQPLVASSIPPLIVSGTSVNLSVPSTPEDKAPVNVDIGCPLTEGKNAFQGLEPKLEPREPSLCAAVFPKEEHSPGPPAIDRVCQEQLSESSAYGWTVMKTEEGRQVQEPLPQGFQESLNTSS
uniref:YY1 associated protein 1 n=1 Tax=Capra hircus TaxID=9925 RepID=A0A452G140_CAPHI